MPFACVVLLIVVHVDITVTSKQLSVCTSIPDMALTWNESRICTNYVSACQKLESTPMR